ncbi:MAG: phosphoenolpyruvate carboxykinase [Planctomycetota bacterium]
MSATSAQKAVNLPVSPRSVEVNPDQETLRKYTFAMPQTKRSEFDNPNITTKVLSRSKDSTFIVTDDPSVTSARTITRKEYERLAKAQDDYIKNQDMLLVEGYIGNNPKHAVAARLIIEKSFANIAGMQDLLYFKMNGKPYTPCLQVIYTPALKAPAREDGSAFPHDRLIAVDLDNGITRVFNSDYFGESKKGGLRMWNKIVYDRGGLPMHAGCKIIPVGSKTKGVLIVGLSGTGKTTTTFTRQNGSSPVQDDFIGWMPDGAVISTENGCFAKTYALDPKFEPSIHKAVCHRAAYLENVSMNAQGKVDFFDESYTKNGRAVFAMQEVDGAADASEVKNADILLILNKNDNLIPAVAKLNAAQAAAYFMLGETQGTAAGGKEEEGKSLRIPGTNPFFPLPHALQGNRFLELLAKRPMEVYIMNTGRVGGKEDVKGSLKVKIPHSSAIVKAVAEGTIKWTRDKDFGYEVAESVPGIDESDILLLQPRLLYEKLGRTDEYNRLVAQTKKDRVAYMESWKGIDPRIVAAVR